MTGGEALWNEFVATAGADAAALARELGSRRGDSARLGELAHVAFRIAMSSLLMGAEDVGKLALGTEQALDRARGGALDDAGWAALASAIATLAAAFHQLANADKSGARVEGLDLATSMKALEGAVPAPPPPEVKSAPVVEVHAGPTAAFVWSPTVDDDMIELFFDEASERLEALATKLIDIERNPSDAELLREIFRDMHTVKGSSAMVGLQPVNHLAHAAEDLIGQVRDAGRVPDAPVIDAVLASLDGLREMIAQARKRTPVTVDIAPLVARLRNPGAAPAIAKPLAVAVAATPSAAAAEARQTIRVDFDKLDRLLNLVGELVLGRDDLRTAISALGSLTSELATERGVVKRAASVRGGSGAVRGLADLGDELSRVERVLADVTSDLDHGNDRLDAISEELREEVMRLRMVPVAGVFRKHVRTVRDLAGSLAKRARLELAGEDTELDKLLVEALDEPLMHLVRNAVDHGIEAPAARGAAGKPEEGTIKLAAAHRGNQVEIRISDDGKGLDPVKLRARAVERGVITAAEAEDMDDRAARELIFRAGFSTAVTVSEVSGRGVGMDVVRQTIVNRLKGTIDVESVPGQGSTFMLKLPLTLAIIQVLVARAGGETFAIPLDIVQRVLAVPQSAIELIGDREVVVVRGHHVPVVRLDHVLELEGGSDGDLQLVLVEHGGQAYALVCEHLEGKREIVIKSLGPLLARTPCVAGATLLGERVALILDVPAIVRRALAQPAGQRRAPKPQSSVAAAGHILLVEDSDIVREALRRLVTEAGYHVTVAVDGVHGLELAKTRHFDLVSTDVMMPRMDGYELTRALRAMPEYAHTPIVMVTSMGERIDRVRGFDAGVDEYITKPHDRQLLLRAIKKLLGHGGSSS
jgi:chemotaxis protein histidine kinase CheA/CheY-like chemotaxis protein